jgi:hypothetical protein
MREVSVRNLVPLFGRHFRLHLAEMDANTCCNVWQPYSVLLKIVELDRTSATGVSSGAVVDQSGRTE